MKMKLKNKITACAALTPVLLTTACMNHVENGEYISTGEILAGAFGNLVIGMGTVFAVLIFLTWVISLFKYVPKLVEGLGKKRMDRAQTAKGNAARDKKAAKSGTAQTAGAGSRPTAPAPAGTSGAGGARVTSITPTPSDGEVAAVIAAAIAAYEADKEGSGSSIKGALQGGPARPKQGALANGIRIRTYKRA